MKYSFVIPIYNSAKYLDQCVDSILAQTCKDFEIILVDDGSTDNSAAICDRYAEDNKNIKAIHKQNGGQSSARNLGVDSAEGEYVLFLDSDDFISDRTFLKELDRIGDKDVIIYKYSKYYSDDKIVPMQVDYSDLSSDKNAFLRATVAMDGFFCSCWSKAVKRSLLVDNKIVFDETLNCEDVDWYYQAVMKAETFAALDKYIVMYRQREGSVTSVVKEKTITGLVFTINKWFKIFNACDDETIKEVMLSSLAKIYRNLLISYSCGGKNFKVHKKDVYALKNLLKHDLNRSVKSISRFSKVFGIGGTVLMLKIVGKIKK